MRVSGPNFRRLLWKVWLLLAVVSCGGVPSPRPSWPDLLRVRGGGADSQSLQPGADILLCDLRGAGALRRVSLRGLSIDARYLDNLVFEARWDGATDPAVSATVAELFTVRRPADAPFVSALTSWQAGQVTLNLRMPFATAAALRLLNVGDTPLQELAWEIDVEQPDSSRVFEAPEYLHARHFRVQEPGRSSLRIEGRGRYIGTTLHLRGLDPRSAHLSIEVDDLPGHVISSENALAFLGGSGLPWRGSWVTPHWGLLWSAPDELLGYRWFHHTPVPFSVALEILLHADRPTDRSASLGGVALWYQSEPRGLSPASHLSHPARVSRRPDAIEAESLLPPLYSSGDRCIRQITTLWGPGWSGNAQMVFQADAPGDFVVLNIPGIQPGTYDLTLAYTVGPSFGTARATIEGDDRPGLELQASATAAVELRESVQRQVVVAAAADYLRLRLTSEGGASAAQIGLDHLRLERAPAQQ